MSIRLNNLAMSYIINFYNFTHTGRPDGAP